MINKTPLRLIDMDADPPQEEGHDAAPVAPMPEHEAITRKVPTIAVAVIDDPAPESKKRHLNWRTWVPAATVALLVAVFIVAMASSGTSPTKPVKDTPVVTPKPQVQAAPPPVVTHAPAPSPEAKPTPAFIRVAIDAEPAEAELSLDGNVVASHRLKLEVPQDRGVHVVSASAPGYLPFNQQVSFASDVMLTIRLHRAQTPPPVHVASKPRAPHVEVKRKPEVKPVAAPATPRFEPGMRLEGPTSRSSSMPIDERNPYKQ